MTKASFIGLLSLMAAGMLASGQVYVAIPIAGMVADRFGIAPGSATWLGTAFGLAYAAGFLVWGPASDWFGRQIILFVGLGTTCLATVAVAYAPSFGVEIGARVLQGLCAASIPPAGLALVGEMLTERWRPMGQAMMSFSFIAAAPVSQLYAYEAGLPFTGMMLLGALGFGLCALGLSVAGPLAVGPGVHRRHPLGRSLAELTGNRINMALWAVSLTVLFGFVVFQSLLGSSLNEEGWSQPTIRLTTMTGMLASFGAGFLIRRFGGVATVCIGLSTEAVALVSAGFPPIPLPVVILGLSMGLTIAVPGIIATVSQQATHETRGMAIAIYSFCLFVGASLAPLFARHMLSFSSTLTLVLPALLMGGAVAALAWVRTPRAVPLPAGGPALGRDVR